MRMASKPHNRWRNQSSWLLLRAPPGLGDSRISETDKREASRYSLSTAAAWLSQVLFPPTTLAVTSRPGAAFENPQRHSYSSIIVNDARNLDQEGLTSPRRSARRVHSEVCYSRLSSSSRLPSSSPLPLRHSTLASSCQARVSVSPLCPSPLPILGLTVPQDPDRMPKPDRVPKA